VCDRIATTGALEESRASALAHVNAAKGELDGLGLEGQQRAALELVADSVVARYA
jgi:geranylgeranyl pyrophosphate synthase